MVGKGRGKGGLGGREGEEKGEELGRGRGDLFLQNFAVWNNKHGVGKVQVRVMLSATVRDRLTFPFLAYTIPRQT